MTLADAGYVVQRMIIDAVKMYIRSHDLHEPQIVEITPAMEELLELHLRKEKFIDEDESMRTEYPTFLRMTVKYGCSDFKLTE